MKKQTIYYHFTSATLRDGTPIPAIGKWLTFEGTPIPCKCGLHASLDPFDALQYARGNMLHQVYLSGTIVSHGSPINKFSAQKRKIVATIDDAEPILRLFARRVALDVIHLWDAPPIVKDYLETGDESKRTAAAAAAGDASWAAAGTAAGTAARAASWAAAGDAAGDAAGTAAGDAARAASWADKRALYRCWFNETVVAVFAAQKAAQ